MDLQASHVEKKVYMVYMNTSTLQGLPDVVISAQGSLTKIHMDKSIQKHRKT